MTPEQLVPIIVKALREISDWKWQRAKNTTHPSFVDASPIWLAQLVVGIVEERAAIHRIEGTCGEAHILYPDYCKEESLVEALRDFGITPEDLTWLKEKVGG